MSSDRITQPNAKSSAQCSAHSAPGGARWTAGHAPETSLAGPKGLLGRALGARHLRLGLGLGLAAVLGVTTIRAAETPVPVAPVVGAGTGADAGAGAGGAAASVSEEPIDVDACQILITYDGVPNAKSPRTREDALALAQRLAGELAQAPNRFAEYVKSFSEGSQAEDGSVGPFRRGRMTPAFEKAVFALPIGGITAAPVETPYGFHIIKRIAVPAVYAARFILISWDSAGRLGGFQALRTREDAQKITAKVYADLQAHPENFREDMMFYSDDPQRHRGGYLPDFYPGRAEPALVSAVEKLTVNGIAPPFESRYGFMIVQRLELLRNRTPLQGFASALHLVISYAGADGTMPAGSAAPHPVRPEMDLNAPTSTRSGPGGNPDLIQHRNWGQARDLARDLAKMAREDPTHFKELLLKHSDAMDASGGGDLGFVDLQRVPPGLYDWGHALQTLKVGEVSDPVETGAGFDILCRKELPLRLHARQILVSWAGKLSHVVRDQNTAAKQAAKYLSDLKAIPPDKLEATFSEFADKYSDDNTGKGGDLGTFAPAHYFPQVTDTLLALKVGQMSEIIETPFGYAILLRLTPVNPLPEESNPGSVSVPLGVAQPDSHTGHLPPP